MNKFIFLIFYLVSLPALAAVSIEVIETYPEPSEQTLAVDQNFYVHLKYLSDTPVRIYVRPFTRQNDGKDMGASSVMLV